MHHPESIKEGNIKLVYTLIQAGAVARTNAVAVHNEPKILMSVNHFAPVCRNDQRVSFEDVMQSGKLTGISSINLVQNEQVTITHGNRKGSVNELHRAVNQFPGAYQVVKLHARVRGEALRRPVKA